MTTHPTSDLLATLEDLGCRVTGPRRQLVAILEARHDAFAPGDILADLPGVGRATVYRTIKLLLDAGALCKTSLLDGSPRYVVGQTHHHHHVVCVRCGRVDEFRHSAVERMLQAMRSEVPGELVGHRLELYMTCDSCLASEDEN